MKRTTYCGFVNEELLNEEIVLKGWIDNRRDLGGIIFLDLRDREGIVQIMADADISDQAWKVADSLRSEYVVEVRGKVIKRDAETVNPELSTGELEVEAVEIKIINKSKALPFVLNDSTTVSQEIRGHYRYLDLRQNKMQKNILLRHRVTQAIRQYLDQDGFIDIETPYLTKSTPEGARDYVVPSRVHEGSFYALPQSPQLFKQLLMSAGFDQIFNLSNSATKNVAEILDMYIYRITFQSAPDYGLSTAISLMRSVVNMVLLLLADRGSKLMGGNGLFG